MASPATGGMADRVWEAARLVGLSVVGGAVGVGVSIAEGLLLVELPFSLPVAIVAGAVLVALGLLVMAFVFTHRSNTKLTRTTWSCAAWCTRFGEVVLLALFALLSMCGGGFAVYMYFGARTLPPPVRSGMYAVLGMAITTLVAINLLDLAELVFMCARNRSGKKGPLDMEGSPTTRPPLTRLFPLVGQVYCFTFTAMGTGLYYGYVYGQIVAREVVTANPRVSYDPWVPVRAYLLYTAPVAAATGFLACLLAGVLPHLLNRSAAAGAPTRDPTAKFRGTGGVGVSSSTPAGITVSGGGGGGLNTNMVTATAGGATAPSTSNPLAANAHGAGSKASTPGGGASASGVSTSFSSQPTGTLSTRRPGTSTAHAATAVRLMDSGAPTSVAAAAGSGRSAP